MRKVVFGVIVVLLVAICLMPPLLAFDGNDYDSGGSDWSSSDWDSDYSSGGDPSSFVVAIAVTAIFMIYLFAKAKKGASNRPNQSPNQRPQTQLPNRTLQIEAIIKAHDPRFSASDFAGFVKRVYIDIQTAWCKRDLPSVRAFLHDNLYDTTQKQIQAKIDQGVVYHYESMVVDTMYLSGYAKDAQFEYLTVYLSARMIDWQENEKTGAILRGDKTTRWSLQYKMKFMRSIWVQTSEAVSAATGHNCVNCGAPLEMTSSAKCAHCDSIVTTGQYSWVLSDFATLRNDTVDEGIRL